MVCICRVIIEKDRNVFSAQSRPDGTMRRSSCPSVKRAKLQLDTNRDFASQNDEYLTAPDSGRVGPKHKQTDSPSEQKTRKRVKQPIANEEILVDKSPVTCSDHLSIVTDLEARNSDKVSELKLMLRASETSERLNSGSLAKTRFGGPSYREEDEEIGTARSYNDDAKEERNDKTQQNDKYQDYDDEQRRERLLQELHSWEEAEKDLDEEIKQSKKSRDDVHIEKLHEYNDLKDACQTVFGRLAELEELTVGDIYKRYDVNVDD